MTLTLLAPDFFFDGYVLDPTKPHEIDITFRPSSIHDAGGRGFWLTGVRADSEAADYASLSASRGDLYDGSANTDDSVSITIGPGIAGWDDATLGVAAGYNRIWFETDSGGAVSEITVTKICTPPTDPPPIPDPIPEPVPKPQKAIDGGIEHPKPRRAAPQSAWASDVRISVPMPSGRRIQVVLGGGFAFTGAGLVHDITEDIYKRLINPTFAPADFGEETVYEDADLDNPPTDLMVF